MKTLIVVSGGDAPGINAAMAAFVRRAEANGDSVIGAIGGFPGVLDNQIIPLSPGLLDPFVGQGGTYLDSSRDPVLKAADAQERLRSQLAAHNVDNVLLFGGDGTLRHIPPLLHDWGIPTVGIPSTIDNDIPGTEITLGFDSACNFAYRTIDGLLATARALRGRIFTVETLGGSTGFIALAVAQGSAAHAALIPEYPYDEAGLIKQIMNGIQRDTYALIVLSEGLPNRDSLPKLIEHATGIRVRDTRLGHGQRGTPPSHQDRVLAAQMAVLAYETLRAGTIPMGIAVVRGGQVTLHEGILTGFPARMPDETLYKQINGVTA